MAPTNVKYCMFCRPIERNEQKQNLMELNPVEDCVKYDTETEELDKVRNGLREKTGKILEMRSRMQKELMLKMIDRVLDASKSLNLPEDYAALSLSSEPKETPENTSPKASDILKILEKSEFLSKVAGPSAYVVQEECKELIREIAAAINILECMYKFTERVNDEGGKAVAGPINSNDMHED
ncbi:uncharacterized protein LOC135939126 [Cloeon dipterum]|uniref:uncharacterized protein LOC135939126 n=1 Tax=Cloeon dipterum TaxID=197152 RepID=UPI0032209356